METSIVKPSNSARSFSGNVLLRDGSMLRMRSALASDGDALTAMFGRCSAQTIRYRFLHLVKSLPKELMEQLGPDDGAHHAALVVVQGEAPDERVVAVGMYSVGEGRPDVAEVSFLVEDAVQKRGLGTILLDTLAELARGRGIVRFTADVLADNRVMLSVFRKAGYGVSATTSYGVTELEFPIARNEIAEARAEAQELEAERASLKYVFDPATVAVVGASRDAASVGGALFRNLIRWGFAGSAYPVNPAAKSIAGVHCYAKISDLPEAPELVFLTVPASAVLDVARQCAAAGARALCVITSGFAELGPDGAAAQRELVAICRASGMRLVGPNCMGLVNTGANTRLLGTFAPASPPPGNIAMNSQSGALGLALLDHAKELGLGVSSFISVGNKADVSGNDLIQYWEADDATSVILLYMESFGNPRKFTRIARRVSRNKPIVAVKSGRTKAGARAATSHTAALASSDRAASALFAQAGIIRVDTLTDFFFVGRLLATQPAPAGRRLAILTNGGGPGILAVDSAEAGGLQVPTFSDSIQARLRAELSPIASVLNPVDMGAGATPAQYGACLEVLCDDPDVDAILVIFIPPIVTPSAEVARAVGEVLSKRPGLQKTVTAVFLDTTSVLASIPAGDRSVPVYPFPEGAASALAAAARYGTWRAEPAGHLVDIPVNRDEINNALEGAEPGWLPQDRVARLLGAVSIDILKLRSVHSASEAALAAKEIGVPVALKVLEPPVLHKADAGGVMLNVSADAAAESYLQLTSRLAAHGIALEAASIAPMAKAGVEVIAGITTDPVFGPLVAFGLGGYMVELYDDVVFRVLPLTDRDA
ncbi:MAG TPA: GNAT family N-acetyltransferase, partial [Blastocatellia bacterium]|nr:GNAT family N-acetyltransferase [Blastocatellia bacterium]